MKLMNTPLGQWLTQAYLQWQLDQNGIHSQTEFAQYLGISQSFLSMLISGKRNLTDPHIADQIATRLNDFSIYDILEIPRPDPRIRELQTIYNALPPDKRDDFITAARAWSLDHGYNLDIVSPKQEDDPPA